MDPFDYATHTRHVMWMKTKNEQTNKRKEKKIGSLCAVQYHSTYVFGLHTWLLGVSQFFFVYL